MWWRGGFEDLGRGIKRVSVTLVRKGTKKEKKHNFTYVPANEAMAAAGLARLEGRGTVEGGGGEEPACGEKRSLPPWAENKRKKKKKNITLLACPRMQAMAAGGLGRLEGQSTVVGIMCGEAGVGGAGAWGGESLGNSGQKRDG